jgi:hypothetical protein
VSLRLSWFVTDVTSHQDRRVGWDLPVLRWFVLALAVGVAGAAAARLVTGWASTTKLILVGAVGLLLVTVLLLVAVETVSAVVPRDLLPVTPRRVSFQLAAGAGLWLAAAGSVAVLVGAVPRLRAGFVRVGVTPVAAGGVVVGALVAGLAWARGQPWVTVTVAGNVTDLTGRALPWLGPLTMGATLGLAACLVAALLTARRSLLFAGIALAWLLTLLAGIAWVGGEALARFRVSFAGADARVVTDRGVWLTYVLALSAGLVAIATWQLAVRGETEE